MFPGNILFVTSLTQYLLVYISTTCGTFDIVYTLLSSAGNSSITKERNVMKLCCQKVLVTCIFNNCKTGTLFNMFKRCLSVRFNLISLNQLYSSDSKAPSTHFENASNVFRSQNRFCRVLTFVTFL